MQWRAISRASWLGPCLAIAWARATSAGVTAVLGALPMSTWGSAEDLDTTDSLLFESNHASAIADALEIDASQHIRDEPSVDLPRSFRVFLYRASHICSVLSGPFTPMSDAGILAMRSFGLKPGFVAVDDPKLGARK